MEIRRYGIRSMLADLGTLPPYLRCLRSLRMRTSCGYLDAGTQRAYTRRSTPHFDCLPVSALLFIDPYTYPAVALSRIKVKNDSWLLHGEELADASIYGCKSCSI